LASSLPWARGHQLHPPLAMVRAAQGLRAPVRSSIDHDHLRVMWFSPFDQSTLVLSSGRATCMRPGPGRMGGWGCRPSRRFIAGVNYRPDAPGSSAKHPGDLAQRRGFCQRQAGPATAATGRESSRSRTNRQTVRTRARPTPAGEANHLRHPFADGADPVQGGARFRPGCRRRMDRAR